jgi:stress-induced morphogen
MKTTITERMQAHFDDIAVTLKDMTGGGDHWEAVFVSDAFAGKSLIARHRAVYAALGELMHGPIHALTFKALTHDEAGA